MYLITVKALKFIDLLLKEKTITMFHRRADYQIVDLLK